MLEFQLQLTTADGKVHSLTEFDHSITLELPVSSDANGKRISMYYLSGNGELEYIGDVNKDGRVAAESAISALTVCWITRKPLRMFHLHSGPRR